MEIDQTLLETECLSYDGPYIIWHTAQEHCNNCTFVVDTIGTNFTSWCMHLPAATATAFSFFCDVTLRRLASVSRRFERYFCLDLRYPSSPRRIVNTEGQKSDVRGLEL